MKLSNAQLDQKRQIGDATADSLVNGLFQKGKRAALYQYLQLSYDEIRREKGSSVKVFLTTSRPSPDWFDAERIMAGQEVFKKYAMPVMTLLGGLALPYCYAGSPGNKALYMAEKMRQSPGKRLADTADFILSVSSPGSFEKSNSGHFHVNKTRLIHAVARYYILKTGNWQNEWGIPINQEDMAGTNLAFSYIILAGLQKSSFVLSAREKEDFIFLWRYIGYQLHIEEDLLPSSYKEASILETDIRHRHFKKSEEGLILTQELIRYYKGMVPQSDSYLIDAQIRYWLGKSVADCVGLQANPVKDKIVKVINSFREVSNFFNPDSDSFTKMLNNHQQLKLRLSKSS